MIDFSVYDLIETINSAIEILIIAFFTHRIFEQKYNSCLPYIISYGTAFSILSMSSLCVPSIIYDGVIYNEKRLS